MGFVLFRDKRGNNSHNYMCLFFQRLAYVVWTWLYWLGRTIVNVSISVLTTVTYCTWKRPGAECLARHTPDQEVPGLNPHWRQNYCHDCKVLRCLSVSPFHHLDMIFKNNVEREVKHQIIFIINIAYRILMII